MLRISWSRVTGEAALILLALGASDAVAQLRSQWPAPYRVETSVLSGHGAALQDSTASEPHVIRRTLGGLGGGIAGVVAGPLFLTGALCEEANYDGSCPWGLSSRFPLGIAIGEPLGRFCGVHWANGRRGSQPLGLLVSPSTFLAGAAWIIHEDAHGGVPGTSSTVEEGQAYYMMIAMVRRLEAAYFHHEEGLIPEDALANYGMGSGVFESRRFRGEFWPVMRENFDPEFVAFFESVQGL